MAALILALVIYIFVRNRMAARLKKAHEELKVAYDRLEETTAAKERMESELRIARDIQMSMVPSVFPDIKGQPLFIYTDGLNEAENKELQQFGDEHLLDLLRHTPFSSARQVIELLSAEVEAHRQGAEPNDDLTMLCLRIAP